MNKLMKNVRKGISLLVSMVVLACTGMIMPAHAEEIQPTNAGATDTAAFDFPTYKVIDCGTVTFSGGYNVGSWRTLNARKVRIHIEYTVNSTAGTNFYVSLYQYPNVYIGQMNCSDYLAGTDNVGHGSFTSEFFDVTKTSDCRLIYNASTLGGGAPVGTITAHVWYEVLT